ncbi:DDB1- and CUL4-associated factor 4 [Linum grandiflorum]
MPQELPGFYYDAVKNRYFPLKGRIPGSSSSFPDSQNPKKAKTSQDQNICRSRVRTHRLIQGRELNGNVVSVGKSKYNFVHEYEKTQASQPTVWRYQGSLNLACDAGLDETTISTQTSDGLVDREVLVAGSQNCGLSIIDVNKDEQHFDRVPDSVMPDRVWPAAVSKKTGCSKAPEQVGVWLTYFLDSAISSVKVLHGSSYGLLTTLGSERTKGAVWILNLASVAEARELPSKIVSSNCTIWTADCNSNASQAVIGTSKGAYAVRLETGTLSLLHRSKSDVFSQQLDKQGNVVLCGLRNGEILTVDARVKQGIHSARRVAHRVCHPRKLAGDSRNWSLFFQVNGNIDPSSTVRMPSSVCSLVSLQLYDQYFFASSMDGAIKLYDHRMTKRGAVQVYEGHVNSHTRLQLRADPSERFLVAGGEDCHLRLWSIKSGELLFDEKVSETIPSSLCLRKGKNTSNSLLRSNLLP